MSDPDLEARLERLTGQDGGDCCQRLVGLGGAIAERADVQAALATAKAAADERRLTALVLLAESGELCQCELQAALGLTHATVNHHMRILADAGLVRATRRGKWVYYELTRAGRRLVP